MTPLTTAPPDFWGRQAHAPHHRFESAPGGTPLTITANSPEVLPAAHLSAGRFSRSEARVGQAMCLNLVVRSQTTPPVPDDWPERLVYSGTGRWLTVAGGEWGHGFADLATREAQIFLSPALAAQTALVSRYFIDHYVLNFLFADWAMLHASGVVDPAGAGLILFVGAHNIGKSTTALRLLRAGYQFLADGMALARFHGQQLLIGGYPIGEVKLRDDVRAAWPEYAGEAVRVREQRKTVVNLRAVHPRQIIEAVLAPTTVHLCFTERGEDRLTTIAPLAPSRAEHWLAANTVFWDEPTRLAFNTQTLQRLLAMAHLHHLRLGHDPDHLLAVLGQLR